MSFEGEFASYGPLRRLLASEKVKSLESRFKVRGSNGQLRDFEAEIISRQDVNESEIKPDLVLAIDGSYMPAKAENGFPGAEFGYVTISSVLIDLKKVSEIENKDFIDPREFRKTEKASTIDSVFPGCNIIIDNEKDAKCSMRKALLEELRSNRVFENGETLLDTYKYLLKVKREVFSDQNPPKSPIEDYSHKDMTYSSSGEEEFICPHSGETLYCTDALRIHELMNPAGSNGEMYGQIMSTLEKLWLVHILRSFESNEWLPTLRRVAFIMDGPLAVFSTSSWLAKVISYELTRINEKQKKINDIDLLIVGIEKSGTFFNHFEEIDTTSEGISDNFPMQSSLLLDDDYIKKNIIFSESKKPYGKDTYFGRKFFYKTKSGQRLVSVVACYTPEQNDTSTSHIGQFSRLGDIMSLLDSLASSRYPNSVSPLISAHAEASIPLNLGTRIFEDIAREIRERNDT